MSTYVRYMDRTRDYYLSKGYDKPYQWAHFEDVPFTPLTKPLADSRLALITTAAPFQPERGDQGPGAAYNGAAKFFEVYTRPMDEPADLRISHIGYDRVHTTAEDRNTWLPQERLWEARDHGRIGALTARLYAVPTVRRARDTTDTHAPQVEQLLREDGADVALLVPV